MSTAELVDEFLAGPQLLRQAIAGMSRDQLYARPVPGKWSTADVVCHISDSDQAWLHRMKRVIAEDRPLLIGYDESRFSASLAYDGRDIEQELHMLDVGRQQMARILRALPADSWDRVGVHSERGLCTLREMVQVEIDHIPHHLKFVLEKRRALGLKA